MFPRHRFAVPALIYAFCATLLASTHTFAQSDDDPPSRVARFALGDGAVSFRPGGTSDWVEPVLNRPMTVGDEVWSDRDGRAELQLDGSELRLGSETSLTFLNLDDRITQVQLSSGTLIVRVHRLEDDETYEIDTPNLAFSVLRPGLYRVSVDARGDTSISVRNGQGEATGGGEAYTIGARETSTFSGTSTLEEQEQPFAASMDPLDAWSDSRDSRWERSESAHYVSRDVIGSEDLDDQGTWSDSPEYGNIWYPSGVEPGWAPYHVGHWAYVAPWGYTWVDARPWGFAPFHYGRWISVRGRWGWIPAPPRRIGVEYVRPVYAPALVAWVGGGAAVGWFALGPREVYVPSYPVSRRYLNNVNVSNTRVNTTIINNVYNTTIINRTTINNLTYVNRHIPGAVAATSAQNFTTGEVLSRDRNRTDTRGLVNAPVRAFAPAVVPTRQAVLGPRGESRFRPPATLENRVATARTAPPPRIPSFEQRQVAMRDNGGKPLSAEQVRRIQPEATARADVRLTAPVKTLVTSPQAIQHGPEHPQAATIAPTAPIVHPNQMPREPRVAPAGSANSVLEREQLQEQQRLQAQQDAERTRVQQQQEREHVQIAQQPDRTRAQQQAAQVQSRGLPQAQLQNSQLDRDRQQLQQPAQQQAEQQRAQQQRLQAGQQERDREQQIQRQQVQQQSEQQRIQQQQLQATQQERDRQQIQRQQVQQQAEQQRVQQQQLQAAQQERDRQQQLERQRSQQVEAAQRQQAEQRARQQAQQQTQLQERQRQIEQQHQQQSQQLMEQQSHQKQALQERQQEQARQQQTQAPRLPPHRPDPPSNDRR